MYPTLSLSAIPLDKETARRLPRRLAYYHLAIPIAADDEGVTVAMAYPEQDIVVRVLASALDAPVIPVRSPRHEISRALDSVWQTDGETTASGVAVWSETPEGMDWAAGWADALAAALGLARDDTPDDLLTRLHDSPPALLAAHVVSPATLTALLNRAGASLLLARGAPRPLARILHVLRGHAPDRRALDWVIPIAHHTGAAVNLLAASPPLRETLDTPLASNFAGMLIPNHPARLTEYGEILHSVDVRGRIRVRQAALLDAVADELAAQPPYDLVVIAAEAYGDFVARLLERLAGDATPFLVIKP
jgi:hypothetical protein